MVLSRRQMMVGGIGAGAAGLAAGVGPRTASASPADANTSVKSVAEHGVRANAKADQTSAFQTAIDDAAQKGLILHIPAGEYVVGELTLSSNAILSGVPGLSVLKFFSAGSALTASAADNIRLSGITLDGSGRAPEGNGDRSALLGASDVTRIVVNNCRVAGSKANGISLDKCSGQITDNEIVDAAATGIFCNDSTGLDISHNHVHDCGTDGIRVWRSKPGEDGTIVAQNRIENIRAVDGGSGDGGNGIRVVRAASVQVTGNRITDCEFAAIRGNAVSDLQVIGNSCVRLDDVAIYAEAGCEGIVIANNLVDKAAAGISMTSFNEGGRMTVVQGNLIRNLSLRGGEQGIGIAVEADAVVAGNLVEDAPGGGIMVGRGKHQRDVNVTGNLIRKARIGIGVSITPEAGYAYITNNMISDTADGGVRAMDHAKLLGPDLARTSSESFRNIAVFGNVSL